MWAHLESLESRCLLSVSLNNGVLNVTGTSGGDVISLQKTTNKRGHVGINLTVNRHTNFFRAKGLRRMDISTGGGDDRIFADFQSNGSLTYYHQPPVPTEVLSGAGDDTIGGSYRSDTLNGQDGNDNIHGREGDDLLVGGEGNDTLTGHIGRDTLRGGAGADDLTGDNPWLNLMPYGYPDGEIPELPHYDKVDEIYGGSGLDTFHEADDPRQMKDRGSNERIMIDPRVY